MFHIPKQPAPRTWIRNKTCERIRTYLILGVRDLCVRIIRIVKNENEEEILILISAHYYLRIFIIASNATFLSAMIITGCCGVHHQSIVLRPRFVYMIRNLYVHPPLFFLQHSWLNQFQLRLCRAYPTTTR